MITSDELYKHILWFINCRDHSNVSVFVSTLCSIQIQIILQKSLHHPVLLILLLLSVILRSWITFQDVGGPVYYIKTFIDLSVTYGRGSGEKKTLNVRDNNNINVQHLPCEMKPPVWNDWSYLYLCSSPVASHLLYVTSEHLPATK